MDLSSSPVTRRRRGAVLEEALLEATWQELVELGYGALTIDGVAQRAGTSRPVLYRRWSSKPELVLAAVRHVLRRDRTSTPDTGNLRDDILILLRDLNERGIGRSVLVVAYLGGYFLETGTSPAAMRHEILGDAPSQLDVVLERAVRRGEVDPARLTPRTRTVAVDLFRHDALMRLGPVPDDVLVEIVDDVFLPLVRHAQTAARQARRDAAARDRLTRKTAQGPLPECENGP